MLGFLARRLAWGLATVVAVPTLTFLFWTVQITEGQWDYVDAPGPSLWDRAVAYLSATFVHFDLGRSSSVVATPVSQIVRTGFPADVALLAGGVLFGVAGALAGGLLAQGRGGRAVQMVAALGLSIPVYTGGLAVLFLFSPFSGRHPVAFVSGQAGYVPLGEDPVAWLQSLWVPWLVLALPLAAAGTRLLAAGLDDLRGSEPLRTALSKGLKRRAVLVRHALPVAVPPLVAFTGARMGAAVLDVALVESVFNIPGSFREARSAVTRLDLAVVQGMTLVATVLVVGGTIVADVVHRSLDPRVR